jgi:PAS domain S-box-containing protein
VTDPTSVYILIVNDRAADLAALEAALSLMADTILTVQSARDALALAREHTFAVAILDIHMPDVDGFELAAQLRAGDRTRDLPILFVSAFDPTPERLDRIYSLGAVDFLQSPVNVRALRAKIAVFVELFRKQRALELAASSVASQQHVTEVQLKDSLARFGLLADNIAQLAWMTDPSGNVFWYNRRWFEYTGTTLADMAGWGWQKVHHPDHVDRVTAKIRLAFATGSTWEDTFPLRRRDGTYRWFLSRAVPFRDEQGTVLGWFGTNTDIHETFLTEQALKESEAALRVSEEQFRVFFELAATGHVVLDPITRRYLRVNARFCEIVGYSAEELLEMTYMDVTHPSEHGPDIGRFAGLLEGKMNEVSVEKRYLRKDQRVIWVNVTASLIRKPDGSPWLQLAVIQDITERKQAEQELHESRSQLQLAIEAAELGTFFYEDATDHTVWSDRTKKLLGYGPDAVGSREAFFARVHPADRELMARRLAVARSVGDQPVEENVEFRVIWPDGSVHHLAAASRSAAEMLPDGRRTVRVVGTLRDVTATKEFEQALHEKVAERTAALQEKTAQLESFCYTVAHDLRSPLRAISGYADIIFQDVGDKLPRDGLAYLDRIKASAARLDLLINDLLAYSRIAQVDLTFDDVLLQPSIEWARQQLQAEIQRKSATVDIVTPLPAVRGERGILDQILLNLLSNALKFVPPDTRPRVQISAVVHDGLVRLLVRDNGIGITPAYHERIFKVFERLKDAREYPGTGVGLAIVAKAAGRLGGRVGVDSEPGRGSTFWVDLPAANSSVRAA